MCVCECVYIVPRLYLLVCEFVCMCAYVCMCVLTLNWPRPPSLQTLAGKHQFFKPKNYLLSEKVWGPGAGRSVEFKVPSPSAPFAQQIAARESCRKNWGREKPKRCGLLAGR